MPSLRACMPVYYDSRTDMKNYVVACWLVSRAYAIVARPAFHCTQTISLSSIFYKQTFCEMLPEMDNPSMLNNCGGRITFSIQVVKETQLFVCYTADRHLNISLSLGLPQHQYAS